MAYTLPRVTHSVHDRINRFYARGLLGDQDYVGKLLDRYDRTNRALLRPIVKVPEEMRHDLSYLLLSTLRKLEKQAKFDRARSMRRLGKKYEPNRISLPRVTDETILSYNQNLGELFKRYAEENPFLCRTAVVIASLYPEHLKQHIIYPYVFTLAHLEAQGIADEELRGKIEIN